MNRVLVIIVAEHVASARALLELEPFNLTPEEAASTFVSAGSPTGTSPATHWWLCAQVSDSVRSACSALCRQLSWAFYHEYDMLEEPGAPMAVLASLGLQPMKPTQP